jgi:arginyl-tRNA synthetase
MNIFTILEHRLHEHLKKQFDLSPEQAQKIVTELNVDPKKQQFGDITTNAALIIAKHIGENPRTVAEKIVAGFTDSTIEKLEIAGPGFVNIFLNSSAFILTAQTLFDNHSQFFKLDESDKKIRYNVEFVSGNPTGPLHFGHGRNGIIGDVLSNVLSYLGHLVTKEYYINDAGAQIKKLGNSFKIRCQQTLGQTIELPEDAYQGEYLCTMAQDLITHDKAKVEQAIADENLDFFADYAKDFLLNKIKETLQDYRIEFDVWFSEITMHIDGAVIQALELLENSNYAYWNEDALWFKSTAFGDDKDRVLKKSNGEVTYAAADVAYLQNKLQRGAEKVIMVVGQDHHSYVQRMKGIMQALGHNPDNLDVILYQLVSIKESGEQMRMSKRAGRIVSLHDVIKTVGADVARFFYLNRKADAHLEFDIDLALKRTDENPVYYIQYAYVRTKSLLEKASEHAELTTITSQDIYQLTDKEKFLLKKIVSLRQLLLNISHNYGVHLVSYYLLDLTQAFHSYYAEHKIVNPEDFATSRSRLALIMVLQNTFELCMQLLGVSCPEKM